MPEQLAKLDPRIPDWEKSQLQTRNCPVCDSAGGADRYVRPDGLPVKHCATCTALFVSPAPSEKSLDRFYASYDAQHRADLLTPNQHARYCRQLDRWQDVRIRTLSGCLRLQGCRVLDVGCGRGEFLSALQKHGVIAHGMDLDATSAPYVEALGIRNYYSCTLADLPSNLEFDLITLNDVVEHPLQPLVLLRQALARLRPGGLLLVWTPAGDACLEEEQPTTFRVDLEHMQYLTAECAAYLSRQLGARLVHLEQLGHHWAAGMQAGEPPSRPVFSMRIKNHIKSLPGFGLIRRLREKIFPPPDERRGHYHLFFILQRPTVPV